MNKREFLDALSKQLNKVPEHDRREMLYDFEEHFELALESGKTEGEVAESLGNPKVIAKDLLVEYMVSQAESDKSVKSMFHAILATISLSFFNIIFLLGPIVAIIGVYIALSATAVAFTLSPLAFIASMLFYGPSAILVEFFMAITLCSLGVLLSIAMIYVGKFLYKMILRYVKFNIRIVKGGTGK
jgi:uncharacterized membrane protein